MKIIIAYPKNNYFLDFEVIEGTTLEQALTKSQIFEIYPETKNLKIGVYSKIKDLNYILQEYDRIEIYSPLIADPKEQRQRRAQKKRLNDTKEKSKWNLKKQ